MADKVEFTDVLRAMLLGDDDRAANLKSHMEDSSQLDAGELIGAAFCVAVEHRFRDDASPAAVRAFMDEARQNFADADPPLKPLVAEVLIRAVLGELHLVDEIDAKDFAANQLPIARKIVAESPMLRTRIDDLIDDAVTLATEWANEAE